MLPFRFLMRCIMIVNIYKVEDDLDYFKITTLIKSYGFKFIGGNIEYAIEKVNKALASNKPAYIAFGVNRTHSKIILPCDQNGHDQLKINNGYNLIYLSRHEVCKLLEDKYIHKDDIKKQETNNKIDWTNIQQLLREVF